MSMKTKEEALAEFEQRKADVPKRIKNEDLYAGSPMYFYCSHCGHLSDVLPETYTERPKHICDECKVLIDLGGMPDGA